MDEWIKFWLIVILLTCLLPITILTAVNWHTRSMAAKGLCQYPTSIVNTANPSWQWEKCK